MNSRLNDVNDTDRGYFDFYYEPGYESEAKDLALNFYPEGAIEFVSNPDGSLDLKKTESLLEGIEWVIGEIMEYFDGLDEFHEFLDERLSKKN